MRSNSIPIHLLLAIGALGAASGCLDPLDGSGRESSTEIRQGLASYQLVTAETAVTPATIKQLSVACPAGTRALGAGWSALDATSAILAGIASHFAPSFDGASWLVNAHNTSGFQPRWKLRVTVVCGSAALAGYEVATAETAVTPATIKQLVPACPAGKLSLGAGWSVLDRTGAILDGEAVHFAPNFDGASWIINAINHSAFAPSWKLRSQLICVDAAAVAGYEVVGTETAVTTGGFKQLEVSCPSDKQVTGAGWAVLDDTGVILEGAATYASFDGASWLTNARNYSGFSPSWKLRVAAICTL
jgi:hypothetical protein